MAPAEVVARGRGVKVCLCFVCVCVGGTADGRRRRRGWFCFTSCVGSNLSRFPSPIARGAHHATESWSLCFQASSAAGHANNFRLPGLSRVEQECARTGIAASPNPKGSAAARTPRTPWRGLLGCRHCKYSDWPLRRLRSQARLLGSTPHSADARNMLKDAQDGIPKHP